MTLPDDALPDDALPDDALPDDALPDDALPDDDVLLATTPAHARALAHPARHRILHALRPGGATISQLANRLATNKGNVAHHLEVLRMAGLVRRGRSRTVRGGTEQYFETVARKIYFDSGDGGAATHAALGIVAADTVADPDHLLHHRIVRLTPAQAGALRRHLESVIDGLQPADERFAEFGVVVGLSRRRTTP